VAALLPQHSLPGAGAAGAAMVAAMAAQQAEVMRSMLAIKAADLDTFKLQFNCCGTGVEKVRGGEGGAGCCCCCALPQVLVC
jgi:hypothetical protein